MPPAKKAQPELPPLGKPAEIVVEAAAPPAADPLVSDADKRAFAIEAMVLAGLSREQAEAAFMPAEALPAAPPVAESEDFGAPLCPHGCHGASWKDVPASRDGVGCEHGSFTRKPAE